MRHLPQPVMFRHDMSTCVFISAHSLAKASRLEQAICLASFLSGDASITSKTQAERKEKT